MTSPASCPACNLPLPATPLDVAAILARTPEGSSTRRIAKELGRREASVRAELEAELAAGTIERLPAAGQSHAQRWRLTHDDESASGVAQAQPHTPEVPEEALSAEADRQDRGSSLSAAAARGDSVEMLALVLLVVLALALGATATVLVLQRGRS